MRFSQRLGYTEVRTVAQREKLDPPTRNGLWTVLSITCFKDADGRYLKETSVPLQICQLLWHDHFKLPIDDLPEWGPEAVAFVRNRFFGGKWYEALDLVEFLGQNHPYDAPRVREMANQILERELSAYRFVDTALVEITSPEEISGIEEALDSAPSGARIHLRQAVSLLADRQNPDFRNSIKESISAVEATVNEIAGASNLTLGEGLRALNLELHGAFRTALGNLYGYTSDGDGIRHSLLDEPNLDYADAKFMLVTCSAFVNYLLAKRGA